MQLSILTTATILFFSPLTLFAARYDSHYSNVGMLCLVNEQRQRYGLPPLGLDERLTRSAQEHSDDQAYMHRMTHTGSDGSSPSDRIQSFGFNWLNSGENVAYGYNGMHAVMQAWMRSPGHRANILSPQFRMFGSAVAMSDGTAYYTQDFGNDGTPARNIPNCNGYQSDDMSYGGHSDSSEDPMDGFIPNMGSFMHRRHHMWRRSYDSSLGNNHEAINSSTIGDDTDQDYGANQ